MLHANESGLFVIDRKIKKTIKKKPPPIECAQAM